MKTYFTFLLRTGLSMLITVALITCKPFGHKAAIPATQIEAVENDDPMVLRRNCKDEFASI